MSAKIQYHRSELTAAWFSLPGLPLTAQSSIAVLLAHNVTVGVGTLNPYDARNLPFEVAWVRINVPHVFGI